MRIRFFALLVVLSLSLSPFPVYAQTGNDYPEYVIQDGDSLGYIASLFNTTVNSIIELNNIDNPDFISPGQIIRIPGFEGIRGRLELATVSLGENFTYLSKIYGSNREQIIRINDLLSPSSVYPGTKLIVPTVKSSDPLIAVASQNAEETGLETAISLGINPYKLSLQNQTQNINLIMSGYLLFSNPLPIDRVVNLFAPSIKEVSLFPLPLVQGGTESISILSDTPLLLTGKLGDYELTFFSDHPGSYYSLQGIHALSQPGLVEFRLDVTFENGDSQAYSQMVLLTSGNFDEDPPLIVDPKMIDPGVTTPENELVRSLVSKKSPTRYWSDTFVSPAVYQEYNSLFGTRRWYNDDPEVYFHTGVDFAGGLTLPITSPAPGFVVFAGPLTVRGNAVFIDHGWGVFSGFFHQETINVKVGDRVDTGQVLGTVGNTGRVNGAGDYYGAGAHLHWELWVNDVQVDPLNWLVNNYPINR